MKTAVVSHGLAQGFVLHVEEVPVPIELLELHWPAWPMNLPLLHVPFYWLTNKLLVWADSKHKEIIAIPITREQADEINPGFWGWIDDED